MTLKSLTFSANGKMGKAGRGEGENGRRRGRAGGGKGEEMNLALTRHGTGRAGGRPGTWQAGGRWGGLGGKGALIGCKYTAWQGRDRPGGRPHGWPVGAGVWEGQRGVTCMGTSAPTFSMPTLLVV